MDRCATNNASVIGGKIVDANCKQGLGSVVVCYLCKDDVSDDLPRGKLMNGMNL